MPGYLALAVALISGGVWLSKLFTSRNRFYLTRSERFILEWSRNVCIGAALLFGLSFALTPPSPQLTQSFKDHPQNFEIKFPQVNLDFFNDIRASSDFQNLLQQVATQQTQPSGQPPQNTPSSAPAIDAEGLIPGDCGKEVPSPRQGFLAYSCGNLLIVVPREMWEGHHADLVAQSATAYQYDVKKGGIKFTGVVRLSFDYDDGCNTGFTEAKIRVLHSYICSSSSIEHAVLIMAHEMGHQLEDDNFPHDDDADLWVSEGFASWISADYWYGHQSPKAFINANYPGDRFVIASGKNGDDYSYNHWAAIIDYIYQTKGRDALFAFYDSGRPGKANDIQGTLGISLEQLQDGYYAWLKQP